MPGTELAPLHQAENQHPGGVPQLFVSDHDRLIDRDELARRLSIGVSTLDRLRAAGKIGPRPIRIGGVIRFLLAEVTAWLSTPDQNGELHDAATWVAVWQAIQRKAGKAGR